MPPKPTPPPLQHQRISSVTLAAPTKRSRYADPSRSARPRSGYPVSSLVKAAILVSAIGFLIYYGPTSTWRNKQSRTQSLKANSILGESNTTSSSFESILVTPARSQNSFASLGPLEQNIGKAWKEAEDSLEEHSLSLFNHWFEDESRKVFDLPRGIPGTGIDTVDEAKSLQDYLDCFSSNGEWIYDSKGLHLNGTSLPVHKHSSGLAACDKAYYKHLRANSSSDGNEWHVRPSLKWYWKPAESCHALLKPQWMKLKNDHGRTGPASVSRKSLCTHLRHKNILLIGDSPTHYLVHDLLLDWTSRRPLTCYGDLYCKEHAICPNEIVESPDQSRQWDEDVRVFERLEDPPDRTANTHPTLELSETSRLHGERTDGTVLRYRRADSMFMNSSPSHPRHQAAVVHALTGVRDINMYAVADGRRSDLTILYKAPVPYPRPSKLGNALNKRMVELTKAIESPSLNTSRQLTDIIELARVVTIEIWLPEALESLRALKAPPAPGDTLLIYRGGWKMQESCGQDSEAFPSSSSKSAGDGPPPFTTLPDIAQVILPVSVDHQDHYRDFRTIFYNVQVVLQNQIMRKIIAPRLGMPYIDLDTPTRVWRSGYVGAAATQGTACGVGAAPQFSSRAKQSLDCLRMCLPSPGLSLDTFLLGSLHTIFDWGWGGPERGRVWTGPEFVPARDRKNKSGTGMHREDAT